MPTALFGFAASGFICSVFKRRNAAVACFSNFLESFSAFRPAYILGVNQSSAMTASTHIDFKHFSQHFAPTRVFEGTLVCTVTFDGPAFLFIWF